MIKKLSYITLLIFLISACNKNVGITTEKSQKQNSEIEGYYYALTKATHDRILGNYSDAIKSLNICLKYNENSDASYYQLSIIYFAMGNIQSALVTAKKATEIDPNNIWYQYQLASIYNYQKDNKGVIEVYKNIIDRHPEKYSIYFDLVSLYMKENEKANALKIIKKLEDKIGINEQIALTEEQIYSTQGNFNEAAKVMENFIKNNPHEVKHLGILAELYLILNREKEAFEQFDKIFKIDPNNGTAKMSIASYYRQISNYDSSFVYYKSVFENMDVELDMKIKEMVTFITNPHDLKLYDSSIVELLNILDSNYYENIKVRTLRADYDIRTNKFLKAQKELSFVVENEKKNYVVWEQLLVVDQRTRDYESLLKHCKEALKYFKNIPTIYYFKGIAYNEFDKNDYALKTFFEGLNYIENNKNLENQFYIQIAETYYKLEDYDSSDDYFEKCLENDKNNALVLNNYSYYLSLRNEKLDRAEELCKRLISINSESYTYLDTYAWVLYKMENYKDALKIIQKAYINGGSNDNVILDHYGDILYKNKKKEEAIKYWKLSLLIENSKEIELKLKKAEINEL